MSPKDQAAAATSMVNVPLGSSDASNHPQDASKDGGGYFLKWSHLTKTVEVKDMSSGGIMGRSSIAGKAVDVVKKVNDSSNGTTSKTILHSVSGYAAPGQVIALMGPSGSGKTSLMNVLSGRSPFQSGQLSINDVPLVSKRDLKKILHHQVAYVKQNDVFFGHLTVKDQLTYTALLRLPNSTSTADKHKEVDSIISQLRLNKVTDSPIKMVSGGERKRVNIATELLTNPKIVLLDEPTSGLDSSSAVRLIHMLQRIAREQQKTIITSIHQPSSEVFMSCFDHLLMLSEGHVVYFGTPKASLGYLQSEVGLPCPPGYNAADHWMDLLVNDTPFEFGDDAADAAQGDHDVIIPGPDTVAARRKGSLRRAILQEAWKEHDVTSADETEHGNASEKSNGDNAGLDADNIEKYPTTWWQQYTILTHRALKNSRSAIFTPLNLIKSFALGLVAGLLWYQLDYTEANVYNMTSFVFFGCTFWVFDSMFMALMAFPAERDVILKERASGSYRLSAYFMAKTTADAPTRILLPLLYLFVSYWMVGIDKTFVVFIGTVGCTLLSVMAGEAIGLLIGAAFYDMQQALTVMTVFALFLMLVGGFFVDNPPIFIAWGKYISPFKYAFDASVQIIFHRPLPCDGSGGLAGICPSGSEGTFVDGAAVSEAVGVQGSIGFNVGLLVVMALVPRYFAYQCLRRKKEGERE